MPSFYNAKRFFLTYPKCNKLPHELVAFLATKGELAYYVVARELHADGSPHLHAAIQFVKPLRGGARHLDFDGHHPNKQDPNNWDACKNYCKKDGDYIEGPEDALVRAALRGVEKIPDNLSELVKDYDSETKWLDFCASRRIPYAYARHFWSANQSDEFTISEGDEVMGTMHKSLAGYAFGGHGRRSLILHGPSGCGKTTWAKINAPKPALMVTHIEDLKRFKKGFHKSIIFDDVDFKHWPRTAQIKIADVDNAQSIHVRYGTISLPSKIEKIFTCNVLPLDLSDPAIRRRVFVCHVNMGLSAKILENEF